MTERPSEPGKKLAAWIDELVELVPHGAEAGTRDAGSRPLDLEALEETLRRSIDRRAAARRRRAA